MVKVKQKKFQSLAKVMQLKEKTLVYGHRQSDTSTYVLRHSVLPWAKIKYYPSSYSELGSVISLSVKTKCSVYHQVRYGICVSQMLILYEWMVMFYISIKHAFQISLTRNEFINRPLVFYKVVHLSLTHTIQWSKRMIIPNLILITEAYS